MRALLLAAAAAAAAASASAVAKPDIELFRLSCNQVVSFYRDNVRLELPNIFKHYQRETSVIRKCYCGDEQPYEPKFPLDLDLGALLRFVERSAGGTHDQLSVLLPPNNASDPTHCPVQQLPDISDFASIYLPSSCSAAKWDADGTCEMQLPLRHNVRLLLAIGKCGAPPAAYQHAGTDTAPPGHVYASLHCRGDGCGTLGAPCVSDAQCGSPDQYCRVVDAAKNGGASTCNWEYCGGHKPSQPPLDYAVACAGRQTHPKKCWVDKPGFARHHIIAGSHVRRRAEDDDDDATPERPAVCWACEESAGSGAAELVACDAPDAARCTELPPSADDVCRTQVRACNDAFKVCQTSAAEDAGAQCACFSDVAACAAPNNCMLSTAYDGYSFENQCAFSAHQCDKAAICDPLAVPAGELEQPVLAVSSDFTHAVASATGVFPDDQLVSGAACARPGRVTKAMLRKARKVVWGDDTPLPYADSDAMPDIAVCSSTLEKEFEALRESSPGGEVSTPRALHTVVDASCLADCQIDPANATQFVNDHCAINCRATPGAADGSGMAWDGELVLPAGSAAPTAVLAQARRWQTRTSAIPQLTTNAIPLAYAKCDGEFGLLPGTKAHVAVKFAAADDALQFLFEQLKATQNCRATTQYGGAALSDKELRARFAPLDVMLRMFTVAADGTRDPAATAAYGARMSDLFGLAHQAAGSGSLQRVRLPASCSVSRWIDEGVCSLGFKGFQALLAPGSTMIINVVFKRCASHGMTPSVYIECSGSACSTLSRPTQCSAGSCPHGLKCLDVFPATAAPTPAPTPSPTPFNGQVQQGLSTGAAGGGVSNVVLSGITMPLLGNLFVTTSLGSNDPTRCGGLEQVQNGVVRLLNSWAGDDAQANMAHPTKGSFCGFASDDFEAWGKALAVTHDEDDVPTLSLGDDLTAPIDPHQPGTPVNDQRDIDELPTVDLDQLVEYINSPGAGTGDGPMFVTCPAVAAGCGACKAKAGCSFCHAAGAPVICTASACPGASVAAASCAEVGGAAASAAPPRAAAPTRSALLVLAAAAVAVLIATALGWA